MKIFSAATIISTKLLLLACFSFMGVESQAMSKLVPCHGKTVEVSESKKNACETCANAEETWSADSGNTISSIDLVEINLKDILLPTQVWTYTHSNNFDLSLTTVYRPPPEVVWKSVQPNTKTTVLVL